MTNRILIISFVLLAGCSSTQHRTSQIDSALTEIQAGRASPGRATLEKMCSEGWTGPCALVGKPADARFPVSILQGVSSPQQSRFMVLTPKKGHLTYYVRSENKLIKLTPEFVSHKSLTQGIDQLEVFDLDLKTGYELVVIGPKAQLWDKRSFKALDLAKKRARIAIVSCIDDKWMTEADKMWPALLNQKPDAIFMIGDNVYVDRGKVRTPNVNEEFIWQRYAETRAALSVFKANPLIPTYAVWDDHDFAKNDGDRTNPLKEQAAEVFFAFFSQKKGTVCFERGPGVASHLKAFGVEFAFLDDRTFRSPNKIELPDQTHFGIEQERWLQVLVAESKSPFVLISGDQFFGAYHKFESYAGSHPASFKKILPEWKKAKVPLLFVSGDRHLTEIIKVPAEHLGYPTFELTSSGIHAKVFPDAFERDPNPQQLVGMAGVYNFTIVEVMRADKAMLQLDVQAFSLDEKQLYQKTLSVKHK